MREVKTFEIGSGRFLSQCLFGREVTTVQGTSTLDLLLTQNGHVHFCSELIMGYLALLLWLKHWNIFCLMQGEIVSFNKYQPDKIPWS